MAIKKYKPTSAGRRFGTSQDFSEITAKPSTPSLLVPMRKSAGRNNIGRVTSRRRGGGHRRHLRLIDFKRKKDGVPAKVAAIEYDPGRSARIALLHYADGAKAYMLSPIGLKVGQLVVSGESVEPKLGNCMPLESIPVGLYVHSVEMTPGKGGQLGRGAGCQIQLVGKSGDYATIVLPSGERRRVHKRCRATIGQVGNPEHQNVKLGKAGRARWKGRRPKVRGTAMNPIAHPMGGGEGRSGGGRHPCSPWGKPSKGGKTRNPRKTTSRFVIRGRKKRIENR